MEKPKEAKKKKTSRKFARKVSYDWSDPVVVSKLIALVEQRPQLWDAGDPTYKLPKTRAWEEVANEIDDGVDWNEAKFKWMSLRVTFKTNVAKLRAKKSGQSSSESATVVWRHFKEMLFLETAEVAQSSQSTTSFVFPISASETELGDQLSPIPTVVGQRRKRTIHSRSSTPTSTPSPARSNGSSIRELAAEVLFKLGDQTDLNKSFGEYIVQECKTLPSEQAEELRLRLHTTVATFKAELRRAKSTVEVQEIPPEAREKFN